MNDIIQFVSSASALNTILLLCILVGGFFALRLGKRNELVKFQKDTIEAMQQRLESVESKVSELEKENALQRHIIETIKSALKQKGLVVTIDGDMVTIADKSGSSTTHRKRTITTTQAVVKKEEV